MELKCLVVDDDVIERDMMVLLLKKIPYIQLVACCSSALEVMEALQRQEVDLVLSDIDMPDMTGMELLKGLQQPPAFIFVTSFADYAVESYELDAVDYIIKPITLPRLTKSINKAIEYLQAKRAFKDAAVTGNQQPLLETSDNFFYISETRGYRRLLYSDVIHVEGMRDFSKIYTVSGKPHVVLVNLKNLERQLPSKDFVRVHRQSIINVNHIQAIVDSHVELNHQHTVSFSPFYKQELLDKTVNIKKIKRSV